MCLYEIILQNRVDGEIKYFPCKQWSEPECADINRWKLSKEISKVIASWDRVRFGTLTFKDDSLCAEAIGDRLNILWTNIKKYIPGFKAIWVKEFGGKINRKHLHFLTNRYVPRNLLDRYWTLGLVDIRLVRKFNQYYMLKYITKPENQCFFDKGERRFALPRGFRLNPPHIGGGGDWVYVGRRRDSALFPDNREESDSSGFWDNCFG